MSTTPHTRIRCLPAWKDALSAHQLDEMGEMFEEIEHQQFGKDGFEDAVAQIARIEQALGIADIARFTAPPPPKREAFVSADIDAGPSKGPHSFSKCFGVLRLG